MVPNAELIDRDPDHVAAARRPADQAIPAAQRAFACLSGRQDLNLRPLDPQSSALPSCATSRPLPKEPGQLSARPVTRLCSWVSRWSQPDGNGAPRGLMRAVGHSGARKTQVPRVGRVAGPATRRRHAVDDAGRLRGASARVERAGQRGVERPQRRRAKSDGRARRNPGTAPMRRPAPSAGPGRTRRSRRSRSRRSARGASGESTVVRPTLGAPPGPSTPVPQCRAGVRCGESLRVDGLPVTLPACGPTMRRIPPVDGTTRPAGMPQPLHRS